MEINSKLSEEELFKSMFSFKITGSKNEYPFETIFEELSKEQIKFRIKPTNEEEYFEVRVCLNIRTEKRLR